MLDYLIAIAVVSLALFGWLWVQQLAQDFARRHPEFGPAREEGGGCGGSCSCSGGHCSAKQEILLDEHHQELER